MSQLYLNGKYESLLSLRETERAIKLIKDYFEHSPAEELNRYPAADMIEKCKKAGVRLL